MDFSFHILRLPLHKCNAYQGLTNGMFCSKGWGHFFLGFLDLLAYFA